MWFGILMHPNAFYCWFFQGPHKVQYGKRDGSPGNIVTAKDIIIATGSVPFVPKGIEVDGKYCLVFIITQWSTIFIKSLIQSSSHNMMQNPLEDACCSSCSIPSLTSLLQLVESMFAASSSSTLLEPRMSLWIKGHLWKYYDMESSNFCVTNCREDCNHKWPCTQTGVCSRLDSNCRKWLYWSRIQWCVYCPWKWGIASLFSFSWGPFRKHCRQAFCWERSAW